MRSAASLRHAALGPDLAVETGTFTGNMTSFLLRGLADMLFERRRRVPFLHINVGVTRKQAA